MRKILLRALAALLLLTMLVPFASCGGNADADGNDDDHNSSTYHTITFNTKGGSTIKPITVKHGSFATPPSDPVMDNYVFHRWETSEGRAFFLDVYKIESDLTLEAIWIKAEDLFTLAPMPDSDGIMITGLKRVLDLDILNIPKIINGKTLEGLGENTFSDFPSDVDTVIVFPDSVRYIGKNALPSSDKITFMLNGTIKYIEEGSFANLYTLTSVKLGEGPTAIPIEAFYSCLSLKTIDIPNGVTVIEESAFEKCSSLLTVVIPASVEAIAHSAFNDCDALKTIFYKGTPEQFDAIEIDNENEAIAEAKVYFYSEEQPTEEGDFWHYDKNGNPVIW